MPPSGKVAFRFALDRQPRVLAVGDGVEALLGFRSEDFLSSAVSLLDRIHSHDADIAAKLFSQEVQAGAEDFNFRLRHADGRIRCIKGHYKKKSGRDDHVILDLTLQDAKSLWKKLNSDALPANFRAMLENTDDFIFFKDRNHVFTAASRPILPTTSPAESGISLLGHTDYDFLPEEYADIYYQLEKEVFAGAPVARRVQESPSHDGRGGWIDNRKYPVKDDKGEIVGLFAIARDVTEQVHAEEALRESTASLVEAQKIAKLGSYVLDITTGVWTSSEVLDGIFGIDKSYDRNIAGWKALIHAEERDRMATYLAEEVLGKGGRFDKEYRIIRQNDQEERWVHGLGRVDLDAQGRPVVMRGTIQDISDRKQSEAVLRENQELLQLLIENAPVALSMFDREMRYLAVNRRARNDFDLGDREVIGHSHYDILPWLPERFKEDHQRALAGETIKSGDNRLEGPGGRVLWGRSEVLPWRTSDGAIGGVILFTEDNTERKKAEVELRESNELLQLFIECAPAALAMLDREMRYLAVSRRWLEVHNFGAREILGHSHYEVSPEIPERWRESHRRALAGEVVRVGEDCLKAANGTVRWLSWEVRPWRTGDGSIGGIIIFSEDISERKQAAEQLSLAAKVFSQTAEGLVITDASGSILDVNDAFTRISGYTRNEVLGKNPSILSSGRQSKEFYADMWRDLVEKGLWSGEIWNRAKDGHVYAEILTISALRNSSGETDKYIALFSDITLQKEQETKLEQAVHYDLLTGLPNKALLIERLRGALSHAARHGQKVAIAYIDIDNFKVFNDRHGHSSGNQILTAVARNMTLALRPEDTIAHLGGDEFVAILSDIANAEETWRTLARVLKAASQPIEVSGFVVQVSVSTGLTFFPQSDEVEADQLLRQANQAMCQAKLEGKGRHHIFDSSLDRSLRERHESLGRIGQALSSHEFELYYQPKVNMCTGKIVGAEALIRWQHPERGLLPPGNFLPIIEGHSLDIQIGKWVIDTALTQMEQWRSDGFDIPISVNISAEHLQQANFVDQLGALLASHPTVAPSDFELEVLESSAILDVTTVSAIILACKKLGVSFSLDDFGTGYASLTYLKRLPIDVLKIDQTFVRDMLDNPEDLSILEGMLGFAKAFRCHAVAEGVETIDHGLVLLRLGCQLAQGYGIARPMPARDLTRWASAWRPDSRWAGALPFDPSNRPVLYASVEHRAWSSAIDDFIHGKRQSAPAMHLNQCRLGAWLQEEALVDGEILPRRGGLLGFRRIDELHQQLHSLAAEVVSLHSRGERTDAQVRLCQLHALRDDLFEKLNNLLQS